MTNNGPDDATNVTLNDALDVDRGSLSHDLALAPTPSQGNCPSSSGSDFSCNLGALAAGNTATVTLVTELSVLANVTVIGSVLENTATVASDVFDPDGGNNSRTAHVVIGEIPEFNDDETQEPAGNRATNVRADVSENNGIILDIGDLETICPPDQSCSSVGADAGDPIYLHSGELFLYEVDLRIPGRGFDWTFSRKYRSGITFNGPLGYNWEFNYNRRLVLVTDQNVGLINTGGFSTTPKTGDAIRMDGMGRVDLYEQQPDGSYHAPAGFYMGLDRLADGSFVERDYRDQTAFYSVPDVQGVAHLTALQDRYGNTMHFSYNAQGQLAEVLDTLGRPIQYAYDADGHLAEVTDFFGRSIQLAYDINGDLVEVTSPAVTGTPNGNDFPQGKTVRYSYSSGFADVRLNHNLLSITAPNEVDSNGPPKVINTYETDPNSPNVDRVLSQAFGGTNQSGVPAGGTNTYQYQSLASPDPPELNDPVRQTTVTDRNGNVTEYQFNRLGNIVRLRELTNRNVRPGDPPFYEMQYEYNADSELIRTISPEGNSTEYIYDHLNPDRFQQGNRLAEIRMPDPDRGGDQGFIETSQTYEPIYNQMRTLTEARGNAPSYVPQNGGPNSPERYATTYVFDYEESCDFAALGNRMSLTAAEVQQLLADAGICAAPLGDVNGDGRTDQIEGNIIRIEYPTAHLLPGSNQAAEEGTTLQIIEETFTYDQFGRMTTAVDPEGNVDLYEYYPENDPDGDGLDLTSGVSADPFGYLRQVTRDAVGTPLLDTDLNMDGVVDSADLSIVARHFFSRGGIADVNGDFIVDIFDLVLVALDFGRVSPSASIRTQYFYDPVGNIIRELDGRGIATDYVVNELNQVVQVVRASAHSIFVPDPLEPTPLTDFQYLQRFFYDFNDNVVLHQVEDRGNTSSVDGSPSTADLPTNVPDPDPVGGPAFVDTVYRYDILDNPIEMMEEARNGASPEFLRTRYRYDPNENRVLVVQPEGNATSSVYDERDLLFQSIRGAIFPPPLALLAAGDPTDYDVRGGLPSTMTYHYDLNRNLIEEVDAADTDDSIANSSGLRGSGDRTRYIHDGFDRRTSVVDSVGNQTTYQYDPAGNVVRVAHFGPVGGASPTADGPDVLPMPVSSGGAIQAGALVNSNLLTATENLYDELGRPTQTDWVLFVNTITTLRTGDIADGASDIGKGDLTPGDVQGIPGVSGITVIGRVSTRTEYDRNSRLTFTVEDDSDTHRYTYDGVDRVIKAIDPEGNTIEKAYDDNNNVIETREVDVSQVHGVADEVFLTTYSYDSLGRLQRSVDNIGQTTDYRYDSRNNMVAMSDAQGPVGGASISRRAFSGGALTVNEVNDFGNVALYFYDGISRKTRQEAVLTASGQGDGINIGADLFGVKTTIPAPDTTQGGGDGIIRIGYNYDRNSLPSSRIDDQGNVTVYLYDNLNRQVAETKGHTVSTTPLDKAKVLGLRETITPTVTTINDPAVITADSTNAQLATAKVRLNAVAALFPPLADRADDDPPTTVVYGYDQDDNLLILEDENDSETYTKYDAINRPIATRVFRSGQVDSHSGDATFAPSPVSDPSNPSAAFPAIVGTNKIDFEYDGLSRTTRATDNNEPAYTGDDSVTTYAYDSLSRVIEETQQIGDLPVRAISSAWRAGNLRVGLTYPNGRALDYTYDDLDRLDTVWDQGAAQAIADYNYIGRGRVAQRVYPINGTHMTYLDDTGDTDVGYDGLRRPVQLRHLRADNSLIVGFSHIYDRMNNKLDGEKLHNTANSEAYDYDSAYRLTQFDRPDAGAINPLHSDWTLDGAGNWQEVDSETRQHSSFNEIIVLSGDANIAILSDDNGNETDDGTFTFQWDFKNRLRRVAISDVGVPLVATYSYDANNRRIRKEVVDGPGTSDYYYDGWRVIEERDGADILMQQYVYGIYIDEPLVLDQNANGNDSANDAGDSRLFYHQNTLYSTFALTDTTGAIEEGYQYDA